MIIEHNLLKINNFFLIDSANYCLVVKKRVHYVSFALFSLCILFKFN